MLLRKRRRRETPIITDGFLFSGASATDILEDVAPETKYDEAPPEGVGFRDADVAGITCGHCSHFTYTDYDDEGGVSKGVCELYEAKVTADKVSNGFKDRGPAIDAEGNSVWAAEYSDEAEVDREFYLPNDEGAAFAQEDNLLWKDIFREGEWEITPSLSGPVEKKLTIVNEGTTDYKKGIIALSDIESSFNDQAIPYVQIPLTDEPGKDHKEMARLNQGFVKKLRRTKGEDGKWRLQAGCHFTEPETLEKVQRGTYADVSAKITPWLRKRDKKIFPAVLRHVCITNTPWIDGMTPFGVAASDDQPSTVESYQLAEKLDKNDPRLSLEWRREKAGVALHDQLALSDSYTVSDIVGQSVKVSEEISGCNWTVPYVLTAEGVSLSAVEDWERVEDTEPEEQVAETPPASPSSEVAFSELSPLDQAHILRGLRFSQPSTNHHGGSNMPRTRIEDRLQGIELSDETAVRTLLTEVLEENQSLRTRTNETTIDSRLEELKGLGFADSPGALKLYRQVAVADDDMPVIEFSDDTGAKHSPSAKELLDSFINALTGGKQIAIQLSDQHTTHGNDDPPPATDSPDDKLPVAERVAKAKSAIGEK